MRIRQVKSDFLYVVLTLMDVEVGLDVAPVYVERLKCCPWAIVRRQVHAIVRCGEAKNSADAPEDVNLHLFSPVSLCREDKRTQRRGSNVTRAGQAWCVFELERTATHLAGLLDCDGID